MKTKVVITIWNMVTLPALLVAIIGCKTTPRSEEKGLEIVARSKHLGTVAEVFGRSYHEIVNVHDLLKLRDVLKNAIDDGDLGDLKKLTKEGGKLGDAASVGYYRVFKKKQDEFVEGIGFHAKAIDNLAHGRHWSDFTKTTNERADETLNQIRSLTNDIRNFSSLLETKALQVSEIVSAVKGNDQKFTTALSLCCRSTELTSDSVVKNRKTFNDLFQDEYQFIQTVEEKFTSMKNSANSIITRARNDTVLADRDRVPRWRVQERHKAVLSDFDSARTELSDTLRDYRERVGAQIGG